MHSPSRRAALCFHTQTKTLSVSLASLFLSYHTSNSAANPWSSTFKTYPNSDHSAPAPHAPLSPRRHPLLPGSLLTGLSVSLLSSCRLFSTQRPSYSFRTCVFTSLFTKNSLMTPASLNTKSSSSQTTYKDCPFLPQLLLDLPLLH